MNMKNYNRGNIKISLKKLKLKKNDLIYVNPEIYKFGNMDDARNRNDYYKAFYEEIFNLIGKNGTIVSNCYSFQVLRYDKKYNNKTTTSSSGNWSEYLRTLKGSVRSDHPVFSVVAVGKLKNEICKNNSFNNYGANSPYEKFLSLNGKILNLGMDPSLNPFRHVMEFKQGVPYCYNKYTKINNKTYSSFVRYMNLNQRNETNIINKRIRSMMYKAKIISESKLGSGNICIYNVRDYCKIINRILTNDILGLIDNKVIFKKGTYPFK